MDLRVHPNRPCHPEPGVSRVKDLACGTVAPGAPGLAPFETWALAVRQTLKDGPPDGWKPAHREVTVRQILHPASAGFRMTATEKVHFEAARILDCYFSHLGATGMLAATGSGDKFCFCKTVFTGGILC